MADAAPFPSFTPGGGPMIFKDHFSSQAGEYARYRPNYPAGLFEWLAERAPNRDLAWDCGTGSGQAAVKLASHFARVVASDPSSEQIAHAEPNHRVEYVVGPAEEPPASVQQAALVTCAQAYHWLDHGPFIAALRPRLVSGGLFAAWGYGLATVAPAVDAIVRDYYTNIVGTFWPPDRDHIESQYRNLPFPFADIRVPEFEMTIDWTLSHLLGYLDTWSASRRYQAANGKSPLDRIHTKLLAAWGDPQGHRKVTWPLFMRAGIAP